MADTQTYENQYGSIIWMSLSSLVSLLTPDTEPLRTHVPRGELGKGQEHNPLEVYNKIRLTSCC